MVVKAAPANKIQCEYRTLNKLVKALNHTLYWRRAVLMIHELDDFGLDRMTAVSVGVYSISVAALPDTDAEMHILMHFDGHEDISIRNTPLVFNGAEYPSKIDIEGDHAEIRHAYMDGEGEDRKVVRAYCSITALHSLDD